jgi:glyoxylase-like metal-dependent hydrolase (beta-lactamase superfamily II)
MLIFIATAGTRRIALGGWLLGMAAGPALAQAPATPYSTINAAAAVAPITVHPLGNGVSMLEGSGGNIGVLANRDGLLIVDCGIEVSRQKIEQALRRLNSGPLRYAVLTHWHWDHADGDGWVRRRGAQLMASRGTIARLGQTIRVEEWGHTFPPVSAADLPNVELEGERRLPFGDETVVIRPYRVSHTDGDLSVYFTRADVLQTGDTFWNGMYPFIDHVAGGNIGGMIDAANANLALATAATRVIPGHGPAGDRADLLAFRDMLVDIRDRIAALKSQGLSLEHIQATRPTASYDARWGQSIISGNLFTALVYRGL